MQLGRSFLLAVELSKCWQIYAAKLAMQAGLRARAREAARGAEATRAEGWRILPSFQRGALAMGWRAAANLPTA
jgi:hypothetical protein